jgi:tetratricopeptide (TPR) repeat protein
MPVRKMADVTISPFEDSPQPAEMEKILNRWQELRLPPGLERHIQPSGRENMVELFKLIRDQISSIKGTRYKNRLEVQIIGWLYDLIRQNVKRGRVFDLRQVLVQGKADCTGYSKLFTLQGRMCGLDAGAVDVVIDNGGRLVPHTALLVLLSGGKHRFVDLWYGSENIKHRRVGLRLKRSGRWEITDVEMKELKTGEGIKYLPDSCVDGITHYIIGNRHLNLREYEQAVAHYSRALELYPGNSRFYYNRAIAFDNLGRHEEAEADYALALHDEAAVTRVLATEHEEVVSLIDLDEKGIERTAQDIYLLHHGFITGRRVPPPAIARKYGILEKEVVNILSRVETRLATGSGVGVK